MAEQVVSINPSSYDDVEYGEDVEFNEDPKIQPVLAYGYCSSKGRRAANEDRVMAKTRLCGSSENNIYGVFDGHGGIRAAEFASQEVPRRVEAKLPQGGLPPSQGLQLFQDVFKQTDDAFCQEARANQWKDGATACVALLAGKDLYVASAGDSRAFLFRYGSALPVSTAHKPGDKSETARIESAGGKVSNVDGVMRVNNDLSTSRAFGDAHMKQWIIADPAVSHRKLTPGDEFLVIATDGLWDVCSSHRACDMVSSVGDATRAARMLVDLAIHQGSFDNVGVVVVDLRSLFTREVKRGNALVPLNMSQKIKNMADEMLDSIDLFHLDKLHSGWLLKESRGSFLTASRWQKRWFVVQMVENQAAWDGSLHQKFIKKVFVLSYFDSERESTSKSPRKPCVIDPAIGCKREEQLDRPGRHCFSLFEASTSTPFILGAGSEEQANIWVGKLNDIFRKNGFKAGGASNPTASMARTLTTMEEQDPNVLMAADGSMMRLPNGAAVNGSFDGPVQVQRTVTGGFAAIGGGWHMQGQQLASMDSNTMGIPGKGALSAEQAAFLGLPIGSVVVG